MTDLPGSYGSMPAAAFGNLAVDTDDQGRMILEHTGGPLLAMSIALFKQRDPEIVTVSRGRLIITGVDRAGQPVELRYRAVGLQISDVDHLDATEGGSVLLERIGT